VLRDGVIASAQGLEDMQNLRLVHLTASREELIDGKIFAPVEKHSRSRSTITPGSANLLGSTSQSNRECRNEIRIG
jgi:hypothetical protein